MNNQIAILADIHGNIHALEAVLKDIRKRGIQTILIAGDLIRDCPDSNEVLNIIRESDFLVIKGNREQYCLDFLDKKKEEWWDTKQMAALLWTFSSLSNENIEYISNLPQSLRFENIMEDLDGDVLVCGHSHIPWFRRVADSSTRPLSGAGL